MFYSIQKPTSIHYWLIILPCHIFKTTWPPQLTRMYMYGHETPPTNLVILISMLRYTSIGSMPKPSPFFYLKKSLYLSSHLNDRCHNNNKVFDKTFVKLWHPIECLNLLWIIGWWHVYYCFFLFWI